jgi:3-phenylpropionate/cinnamic acid dioxygenase small subunit
LVNENASHQEQLERRVTRLEEGQAELLSTTSRIESIVENLASGQQGVFKRINRPWQWGIVVAAFVALVSVYEMNNRHTDMSLRPLDLHITTLQNGINHLEEQLVADEERQREIHTMLNRQMVDLTTRLGRQEEAMANMKMLEDRYNRRIHAVRVGEP